MDLLTDIDEERPVLYSRVLVLIYSFFLTPLGGAILIAINLIQVKRYLNIIWLVIAVLLFEILFIAGLGYFGFSALKFFLLLGLGAILFAFPVWSILLKGIRTFRKRGFWVPIIVLLLIWIPLMVLNFIDWRK